MSSFATPELDLRSELNEAINIAAAAAYEKIAADRGLDPEDMHRLAVCSEASQLIVNQLLVREDPANLSIRQEIKIVDGIGLHTIVVVSSPDEEIIADATWQQLLLGHMRTPELPKVLIGPREEVIKQAQAHGINKAFIKAWQTSEDTIDIDVHRQNDREAERASDNYNPMGGVTYVRPVVTGAVIASTIKN